VYISLKRNDYKPLPPVVKVEMRKMFTPTICVFIVMFSFVRTDDETCHEKFEYVFKVMYRLSEVEKKLERLLPSKESFNRQGKIILCI
jgi:hypothetical protein